MLAIPDDWGNYTAQQKIDFFNAHNVTPAELQAADPTLTDEGLAWMRSRGYAVQDAPAIDEEAIARAQAFEALQAQAQAELARQAELQRQEAEQQAELQRQEAERQAQEAERQWRIAEAQRIAAESAQAEQVNMELPRFVVAAIQNAAAGTVDDKVAWLNSQRSIMSDEEARARAEAVLGVIPSDDWEALQNLADQAQAKEAQAPPEPFYGAPEGWRYSLVTGELVPEEATVEQLVAYQTDQGLTTEQLAAENQRLEIIAIAEQPLEDKIAYLNAQLDTKNEAQVRADIESVLGKQDDTAWAMLTQYAAEQRAPDVLSPPAAPSTPTAPVIPSKTVKPFIAPGTIPDVQPPIKKDQTMSPATPAAVGNVPLPSDWDRYTAAQKITWFNRNAITPTALKAAGVSDADIAWMQSNGYIVGATQPQPVQGAGINPVLIAAAAALLLGG